MMRHQHTIGLMRGCFFTCALLMLGVVTSIPGADNEKPKPLAEPTGIVVEPHIEIAKGQLDADGKKEPGTLGNVVEYLRKLFPGANIVLAPGVADIKVGDLKLNSIGDLEPVLEALRVAAGNAFIAEARPPRQMAIDPQTGLPRPQDRPVGEFFALLPDPSGSAAGAGRVVEVFNMAGYLRGKDEKKADESLMLVQDIVMNTISSMQSPPPRAITLSFRFHPGASLLVATGSPSEIDVARKVILALPDVTPSRVESARSEAGPPDPQLREQLMRRYGIRPPANPAPGTPDEPRKF